MGGKVVPFSYVGTGTYGVNGASSLTFDEEPMILLMLGMTFAQNVSGVDTIATNTFSTNTYRKVIMVPPTLTTEFKPNNAFILDQNTCYGKKSADGKTISWYNSKSASGQFNGSGSTYYGIAIFG